MLQPDTHVLNQKLSTHSSAGTSQNLLPLFDVTFIPNLRSPTVAKTGSVASPRSPYSTVKKRWTIRMKLAGYSQ